MGARHIWGTVRAATAVTVRSTIAKLSSSGVGALDSVLVKRKFKTQNNSKRVTKWWFVVRGEESALQAIEKEWPHVAAQTAWKLEPLFSHCPFDT